MPVHSLYEFAVLRLIEQKLPPFEPWTLEDLGELPSPVAKKEAAVLHWESIGKLKRKELDDGMAVFWRLPPVPMVSAPNNESISDVADFKTPLTKCTSLKRSDSSETDRYFKISKTLGRFKSPLVASSGNTPATPLSKKTLGIQTPRSITTQKPFRTPTPGSARSTPLKKSHADPEVLKLQEERCALQRKIKEGEAWERKLGLFNKFMENDEPERVELLRDKWSTSAKEILATLRDSIGAVVIPEGPGLTREALLLTDMAPEVRLLTLKEVCSSFRFDIAMLGSYNENDDCFDD